MNLCEACGHLFHDDTPCPKCECTEGASNGQGLKPKGTDAELRALNECFARQEMTLTDYQQALGAFGSGHPMGAADLKQKALHDTKSGQHGALQNHHAAEAHKANSAKKPDLAAKHSAAAKAHGAAKAAHELARSQPPDHPSHAVAEKKSATAQAASDGTADVVPQKVEAVESQAAAAVPSPVDTAALSADQLSRLAPAPDSELPPDLRGKGLVRGQPVATWMLGRNETRDGRVFIVDDKAVTSLLADGNSHSFAPLTYVHEDGEPRNAGYAVTGSGKGFSVGEGEGGKRFVYCDRPYWTGRAAADIASGHRGPVSPDVNIEPLDPKTLAVLTPSSQLYAGPGRGRFGTAYMTNTFRPLSWRVAASLVPVPANKHLPTASLSMEHFMDSQILGGPGSGIHGHVTDRAQIKGMSASDHASAAGQHTSDSRMASAKGDAKGAALHDAAAAANQTAKEAATVAESHPSPAANANAIDKSITAQNASHTANVHSAKMAKRAGKTDADSAGTQLLFSPTASLTADASASQQLERSKLMKIDYQLLGLAANASEAQKQAVRRKIRSIIAKGATAKLAAAETFDKETILGLVRQAFKIPVVVTDEQLSGMIDDALDNGADDSTEDTGSPSTPTVPDVQPAAAAAAPVVTAPLAPQPDLAKLTADAATSIRAELDAKEVVRVKAAKDKAIDDELKVAETSGKLTASRREEFRARLSLDTTADGARADLSSMRPGFTIPSDSSIGGGRWDASLSVDELPTAEAVEILSRACAWNALNGRHPSEFGQSLAAVRNGDPQEAAYHAEILSAIPDWSPTMADNQKPFGGRTRKTGEKWAQRLCASALRPKKDFDFDKLGHIFGKMRDPDVSNKLSAIGFDRDFQSQSLALYGSSQKLAGETGYFQPGARFPIPSFAYGVLMGEYGGAEIAQEFQGGVNKQVYYPIYGNEALRVFVNSGTGVIDPIGPESMSKPSMKRAYEYKLVNLRGYGNIQWVDRDEAMSADTVLPIGLMAMATQDSMYYARNEKEYLQAQYIRNTAHYTAGFYADLSTGGQFTDPSSKLVQALKAARLKIWSGVGAYQAAQLATLMSPYVLEALSVHPQVITAAQTAGVGHLDKLMAYAPQEMLVALFGPIITPTCRISTAADGSNPDSPWGTDLITAVISREIIAPRAFVTVQGAGYPITQAVAEPVGHGLRGRDGIDYSDVFAIDTVGATGATTSAAYLWQNAVAVMTP